MKKKSLGIKIIWSFVGLCWLSLVGIYFLDPSIKVWTIAVTGVAIATEVGFWLTAGILGVTMWESRKHIFGFAAKKFKRG